MARSRYAYYGETTAENKLILDPIADIMIVIFAVTYAAALPYSQLAPELFASTLAMSIMGGIGLIILFVFQRVKVEKGLTYKVLNKIVFWAVLGYSLTTMGFIFARFAGGLGFELAISEEAGNPLFMIAFYTMIAVPEELFYRGLIQTSATEFFNGISKSDKGFIPSLIFTSIIFMLAHGYSYAGNFIGLLGVFLASLGLGFVAYQSKRLSTSMIAHAGNNLVSSLVAIFIG